MPGTRRAGVLGGGWCAEAGVRVACCVDDGDGGIRSSSVVDASSVISASAVAANAGAWCWWGAAASSGGR